MAQNIMSEEGIIDATRYVPQEKSRLRAINDFCVICMGGSPHSAGKAVSAVRECPSTHCPLYLWRPYRQDKAVDPERAERGRRLSQGKKN